MSTIKSSSEHLTLNADGAGKEVKFQADGVEKASISSTGIDVTGSVTCDGLTVDANGTHITLDTPSAGQHNWITWKDGGTAKWELNKDTNNNFSLYNYANGSTDLLIDSSGNVGIGATTDIDSRLHLKTSNAATTLKLERREVDGILGDGDGIGSILFESNDDTTGASGVRAQIDAIIQNTSGGAYLKFSTANSSSTVSEAMRIIASGNVGIGTSSPDAPLSIQRPSNNQGVSSGISLKGQDGTTQGGLGTDGVNDNAIQLVANQFIKFHTNNIDGTTNERLRIDSSGNVGIGESSPNSRLIIKNTSANDGIRIHSSTTGEGYLIFRDDDHTSKAAVVYDHADDHMHFKVNGAEKLHITSSGNVGIGTSSPSRHLQVQSTGSTIVSINSGNTSESQLHFADTDDDNIGRIAYDHSTNAMEFWSNDAERLRITSDGRGLSQFTAKAWCYYEDQGGSTFNSHNISSITVVSTGKYKANFTNNMANNDYAAMAFNEDGSAYNDEFYAAHDTADARSTSQYGFWTGNTTPNSSNQFNLIIFGD